MSNILIVDDQRSVLLTLEALLSKEGHHIMACTNALDAMRALAQKTVDLVITDAIMPGGSDGFSLTRTIRKQPLLAHVPVILLTGKREKSDVEKGIDSGAVDYIVKPIDPELLLAKIRNVLLSSQVGSLDFAAAATHVKADWEIKTEITAVSEMGFTIASSIPLPKGKILRLNTSLFDDIGIAKVPVRIDACEELSGAELGYKIQAHFVGISEKELAPIRLWIRAKKNF